jgi:hypothetical protein
MTSLYLLLLSLALSAIVCGVLWNWHRLSPRRRRWTLYGVAFAICLLCVGGAFVLTGRHALFLLTTVGCIGMAAAAPTLPAPGGVKNGFPYWLSGQTVIAAGGGQVQFAVNINDHAFNGLSLLANSTGDFSTQITIGGRSFSSGPVHNGNMWGTGSLPFNLALPMTFPVGTVVQITFVDLSGNPGNTINWAIHGYQHD